MIKSLHLKDFQSHKDTELHFNPLFNIIVGASGNGKSAIIRALRCLSFNNIGTSEVRLPDAKSYKIAININDREILREKGVGINSYTIDKNTTLVDVNKDVPNSVQQILNIKKIELDSSCDLDIQFSSQLEGPFMLSEKDSVKMKFLNTLSGTNAVDLAAKKATALCKENSRIAKTTREELTKLKDEAKTLQERLDTVSERVKYLKKEQENLNNLESLKTPLLDLKTQYEYLHTEYKKVNLLRKTLEKIDLDSLLLKIDNLISLITLSNQYSALKSKYSAVKRVLEKVTGIDVSNLYTQISKLETLLDITKKRDSFKKQYLAFKNTEQAIQNQLKNTIETYGQALHTQKSCPVCGNAITDACIDKIINSL